MPRKSKNKTKSKIHKNFETVTQRLLELIEGGTVPWHQPWHNVGFQNLISQKPYSGINPILCQMDCMMFGHSSPYYVGIAQCTEKGWSVKKGSKANWLRWGAGKTITERVETDKGQIQEKERFIRAFKWLMVFNIDCVDDSQSPTKIAELVPELATVVNTTEDDLLQAFVNRLGADISYGGNVAFYQPAKDIIRIPNRGQFNSRDSYWSTLFHELCHWTMIPKRLNRPHSGDINDPLYHREELIADLGASFLGNHFGLASIELEHHADYLKHYWSLMNPAPQAFFKAAHEAQKAANYLLKMGEVKIK